MEIGEERGGDRGERETSEWRMNYIWAKRSEERTLYSVRRCTLCVVQCNTLYVARRTVYDVVGCTTYTVRCTATYTAHSTLYIVYDLHFSIYYRSAAAEVVVNVMICARRSGLRTLYMYCTLYTYCIYIYILYCTLYIDCIYILYTVHR